MSNKIQNRRGNRADLPNPLDNGEFGWSNDTRELFMGNGVANENLKVAGAPVTTDFNVYAATAALGGDTVANGRTGLRRADTLGTGTTTATTSNKLVNTNKDFSAVSDLVGLTVFNTTDSTWAKIDAVDSATVLSLSVDIMTSGEDYEIASSISTIDEAWGVIPAPFSANPTLRISPGTFTETINLVGKSPTGNLTVTIQGSGDTGGSKTTIDGQIQIRQRVVISEVELLQDIRAQNASDVTWGSSGGDAVTQIAPSLLYTYEGSATRFENGTYIIGNNPTNVVNIAATVTDGYTIYVATTAFGGSVGPDGLEIVNGTNTGTGTTLTDSSANFNGFLDVNGDAISLVDKTVLNTTDNTWAKINSVDSDTSLTLSVSIMASSDTYVIADACSTIQAATDSIPGSVSANIDVKVSNGTFDEAVLVKGKAYTGSFVITYKGTLISQESGTWSTNGTTGTNTVLGTATDTGSFTGDSYGDLLLLEGGDGLFRPIDSHDNDTLTIVIKFTTQPLSGETWEIFDWGTIIGTTTNTPLTLDSGQQGVFFEDFKFNSTAATNLLTMLVQNYSSLTLTRCRTDGDDFIRMNQYGAIKTNECVLANIGSDRGVHVNTSKFETLNTKITAEHATDKTPSAGLVLTLDGGFAQIQTSVLDGGDKTGVSGVSATRASGAWLANCFIRECNIGLKAAEASAINHNVSVTFEASVTTDKDPAAATDPKFITP